MTPVHCSQGHQNPSGSRFCHSCGEQLAPNQQQRQGLSGATTIVGLRYRMIRELGHGGFGRTYLAEDLNRFNEPCVLKEFAPQVRGTYALQKAEELFEREAGVLYKLQHAQIPRFRELFRAEFESQGHLFLVQDYIEGQTYRQILEARRQQGAQFTESEIVQLLTQLLPVLHYIHSIGVIHRDISPDNLMLRDSDLLPVLIDFGGVKQIAATAASQYMQPGEVAPPSTRLGKVGYAPEEQMQLGRVSPQSDLYALAVTVLVLLTGKEPQEILGSPGMWQRQTNLSPMLINILEGMLSSRPGDRYLTASEVMQALSSDTNPALIPTQPPTGYVPPPSQFDPKNQGRTISTTPAQTVLNNLPISQTRRKGLGGGTLFLLLLMGGIGVGLLTSSRWVPLVRPLIEPLLRTHPDGQTNPPDGKGGNPDSNSNFPPEERVRKQNLSHRRQALGVDEGFLIDLTNATFYDRYPEQQGRTLTANPEDAEWRSRWDATANEWLDTLENNVSSAGRGKLGSYTSADREGWKQAVNQLYVGSRSLNDLADAKFFHLFPLRGQNFIDQPIGQVWQAIAADVVQSLQTGKTLERIRFEPGRFTNQVSGSLSPGEGKVYIANLSQGQILRMNLQAPRRETLLSFYLPRPTQPAPFLLEDSAKLTWSGNLTQSGFYEVVVVSIASKPISYQLNLTVDNVTSAPVEPTQSEAPGSKN